jgi:hypothetical protein
MFIIGDIPFPNHLPKLLEGNPVVWGDHAVEPDESPLMLTPLALHHCVVLIQLILDQ